MQWPRRVLVWVCVGGMVTPARAQDPSPERPLPVAGTLLYNLLFLSRPSDAPDGGFAARFGGRFALRASPRSYVGLGVGSWVQARKGQCVDPAACGTFAVYWSEAVVYQLYAQHAPSASLPGWLRLGLGVANTSTLVPGAGLIDVYDRWRGAVTGGAGADLRIGGHLFLTPSIDYTVLTGVRRGGPELHHALAMGLGVTIR